MTVWSYYVTYAIQSESTLYSCMDVKAFLARNRHDILSLSDCKRTRTQKHLVRKRTLNYLVKLVMVELTKLLSVRSRTKWL